MVHSPQSAMNPSPERRRADPSGRGLNKRLRQAFLDGAEEQSRLTLGRGLTDEELERIVRHYPGDLVEDASPPEPLPSDELIAPSVRADVTFGVLSVLAIVLWTIVGNGRLLRAVSDRPRSARGFDGR
jgi:hypothetical protein